MANPTTNYGWPMPTSTDLVTDLPADFAAFGQPVDTSLKALNPETTLGDIAYRSSTSNTNTRLGIGSSGQVLTVAGGVPSWATPAGGSWSQAATGTLSGASVAITGLTGQKYYVALIGWSYLAGSGNDVQIRFNNNSTAVYRRTDSDSAVTELYPAGSEGFSLTSTRSIGFFVDMANTSMAGKPLIPVTPRGNVSGGWFMDTTAITEINILTTGSTFDAGTYYVWSFA